MEGFNMLFFYCVNVHKNSIYLGYDFYNKSLAKTNKIMLVISTEASQLAWQFHAYEIDFGLDKLTQRYQSN